MGQFQVSTQPKSISHLLKISQISLSFFLRCSILATINPTSNGGFVSHNTPPPPTHTHSLSLSLSLSPKPLWPQQSSYHHSGSLFSHKPSPRLTQISTATIHNSATQGATTKGGCHFLFWAGGGCWRILTENILYKGDRASFAKVAELVLRE